VASSDIFSFYPISRLFDPIQGVLFSFYSLSQGDLQLDQPQTFLLCPGLDYGTGSCLDRISIIFEMVKFGTS
jgi:hypothetical protein